MIILPRLLGLLLAASLGAFVLARRGRLVLGAMVAGVATGVRVSGVDLSRHSRL